jgi:hypothetical protein
MTDFTPLVFWAGLAMVMTGQFGVTYGGLTLLVGAITSGLMEYHHI